MNQNCIFCDIRDKKIPAKFVYEDENIMAFPDIHPVKPVHILVIPKKHIEDFSKLTDEDDMLLSKLRKVIQKVVAENNLLGKGYRIGINGAGAQIINHLHFHVYGPLGPAAAL